MYRARSRTGLSLREAAAKVSRLKLVSSNTLGRLEHLSEPPRSKNQRHAAFIASLAYKIDPREFDLSENDRPPWATDEVVEELRRSIEWYSAGSETAGHRHLHSIGEVRLPGIW